MEQSKKRYIIRLALVAAIILCTIGCSYMVGRLVERHRVKQLVEYMSANVGEYEKNLASTKRTWRRWLRIWRRWRRLCRVATSLCRPL